MRGRTMHLTSALLFRERVRVQACGIILILLIPAIAIAADSWDKRDWTRWAETDCDILLGSSPWSRGGGGSVEGTGYTLHSGTTVQFRSALPIRLALARKEQFHSKYSKLTLPQKQQLDAKIQAELEESFSDRVILRVTSGIYETGKRSAARQQDVPGRVRMTLPSGHKIESSQPESIKTTSDYVAYEVTFPRIINGRPLLEPGDKKFSIDFDGAPIEFDASKMYFRGKLEF